MPQLYSNFDSQQSLFVEFSHLFYHESYAFLFNQNYQQYSVMDDLEKYIKKELSTIIFHAKKSTPSKPVSLHKIKTLVKNSPLKNSQKKSLFRSISQLQVAIKPKSKANPYAKQLFYENMILAQNLTNFKKEKKPQRQDSQEFNKLLERLQQLRKTKTQKQDYLCQLMLKAQRLNRLVDVQKSNNENYLRSKQANYLYQEKKDQLNIIEKRAMTAAKANRKRTVHSLMNNYRQIL